MTTLVFLLSLLLSPVSGVLLLIGEEIATAPPACEELAPPAATAPPATPVLCEQLPLHD